MWLEGMKKKRKQARKQQFILQLSYSQNSIGDHSSFMLIKKVKLCNCWVQEVTDMKIEDLEKSQPNF